MRVWMLGSVVVLVVLAGCKKQECPAPTPCPAADCDVAIDDGGAKSKAVVYRLVVDKERGSAAFTAEVAGLGTVVVPLDPKGKVFVNGKPTDSGTVMAPGDGGCPCQLPVCAPFCRPAAEVLSLPPGELFPGRSGGDPGATDPVPAPPQP